MQKDKEVATGPWLAELVSLGVYKRSQGRLVRRATFAVVAAAIALGAWKLHAFLQAKNYPVSYTYVIPSVVAALGAWFAFRLVCIPRFADFLIAVEQEMNKVSWPSKSELYRQSLVVLITIFSLAFLLFFYDVFWQQMLQLMGIIPDLPRR